MDALDRIFTAKKLEDDGEKLLADLVSDIATDGGVALLADLISAGHDRGVIACALQPETSDRRAKPLMRASVVNGVELVWLTTLGWSRAGYSNKRESPVGTRTARHRTAPALFDRWIRDRAKKAEESGILVSVDRGRGLRLISEEMTQRAWALIRQGGTAGQEAGLLLTRPVPDALLVEDWHPDSLGWRAENAYPHFGSPEAPSTEIVVAVEVQLSDTASVVMTQKVRAHDGAMRYGGGWNAVLWVVDSRDVVSRLQRTGVGNPVHKPGHYIVEAQQVGLHSHEALGVTTWNWVNLPWAN